jgi:hypothetical protein
MKEKVCIYCKTEDRALFKGVEHLIPQSFGTFGTETPTLNCVCDDCNNFFGRSIDQAFARDSWEGVTRYKQGISSSEQRAQKRLDFRLGDEPEMGMFSGAKLAGVDSKTGKIQLPLTQFQILNKKTDKYDVFEFSQIKDLKLPEDIYGAVGTRKTKLFAPTDEEYDKLVEELKKIGIDSSKNEKFRAPFIEGKKDDEQVSIPVEVVGTIDSTIKRAIVKILLNFTANYVGVDELLKPEWDKARNYVRNDTEPILGKLSTKPFWGEETDTMRFAGDSFNILVDNEGVNVIGKLQAYNFYTYEFILVANYNLPDDKCKAMRFTKGHPPFLGEKRTRN